MSENEGFLHHEPCPKCGSRDNLARYGDAHGYCFGCGYYEKGDGNVGDNAVVGTRAVGRRRDCTAMASPLIPEIKALPGRNLGLETCEFWGYGVADFKGQKVQVASYKANGAVVAQKLRFRNKDFLFLGDPKNSGLYGQHLWRDKGKMVIVTEGEIDAMSVSQVQAHKWPVVSVPNGAQGAKRAIAQASDWLCGFDSVVLMFDNDEPGQAAAREAALALPPGKAKIAALPLKDANEMLKAGRGGEILDAAWGAKTFRPDGIVADEDIWEQVTRTLESAVVPYPWEGLQDKLMGMRRGELITLTAGSGIGKTAVARELAYHLVRQGQTIGYIALEESIRRTALGLMGVHLNRPLHLDQRNFSELDDEDRKERQQAYEEVIRGRVYMYDHFGSLDVDNLLSRVRYLAKACECTWVFLDHLSIVVSGLEGGDERRMIDNAMTMLRSLVEETGIGLVLVSHLKRPEGNRGHEDGAQTHVSQLRGSAAIAQLSDAVIGLERNQQADEDHRDITIVRVLKDRFSGNTGEAGALRYDRSTGRLKEVAGDFPIDDDCEEF